MAEPPANVSPNPILLKVLQQITAEERYELLNALEDNESKFIQFNFGESKGFQVEVKGGKAYIADTINISIETDVPLLQQVLEELVAQKPKVSVPYFYPSDLGSSTFVGRAEELEQLHYLLQSSERVAIAAATGMGGVGKTQLAWQYARQCEQAGAYAAGIWWLRVRDANLSSQILNYSLRMGLGQPPDELEEEADRVKWCFDRWGQVSNGKRLLILDDLTDYKSIRPLLPESDKYHVLLTTRRRLGPPIKRLDLGVLSEAEALELLRQLVEEDGRLEAEPAEAKQLCEWLGYLPLGIELVGRYLADDPDLSIGEVLSELNDDRLEAEAVSEAPGEMPYQRNLLKAFELSWRKLNESGQQLGYLLSLFALAPIPWRLVKACLPDWKDADLRQCRTQQLIKRSLLQRLEKEQYQLHQVIREAFVVKRAKWERAEAMEKRWAEVLVSEVQQVPQTPTISMQRQMAGVIPHLEELAQSSPDGLEGVAVIRPHISLGRLYAVQSLWQKAEHWISQAVEVSKQHFGAEHPYTVSSLNHFAGLYDLQGRYSEAELLYEQALGIGESQLGPGHPGTVSSLGNLALLYRSQGRYTEAEPLLERALALRESQLGPEHPDIALSVNNLAGLYQSQGRYTEAEPLLERALALRESQLGPEHPDIAMSLNNLAELYRSQGLYSEAEPLYERALAMYESQLGPEHPDIALSLNNLAELYRLQGLYSEAEPLYERALAIYESQLGPEHPSTALSLNNLALLYGSQGRYSEAEPLYERALAMYESQLGPEHPSIATSLNNLAKLYRSQGRYSEAEPLYERALAIYESQLGPEHPCTASSLNNLAVLYANQGQWSKAELMMVRALQIRQQSVGSEHPDTQSSVNSLANVISDALKDGKAHELSDEPMTQVLLTKLQQQNET